MNHFKPKKHMLLLTCTVPTILYFCLIVAISFYEKMYLHDELSDEANRYFIFFTWLAMQFLLYPLIVLFQFIFIFKNVSALKNKFVLFFGILFSLHYAFFYVWLFLLKYFLHNFFESYQMGLYPLDKQILLFAYFAVGYIVASLFQLYPYRKIETSYWFLLIVIIFDFFHRQYIIGGSYFVYVYNVNYFQYGFFILPIIITLYVLFLQLDKSESPHDA